MRNTAKLSLLLLGWCGCAMAQFQGYDILLPTVSNQVQSINSATYTAQNMINVKPAVGEEVHLTPLVVGTDEIRLHIDPSIIIPFPYSNNSNTTGVPPITDIVRTLDFSLPVGKTSSSYNVSMVGSLNYNIPISVALGTKGIEPKIAINYNSLNTNGLVGYGWNISGIESITREGKTLYHNNTVKGLSLTNADWFVYNGNRLVPVNGQNGANNTQYRTESETFVRVTSHNSVGNGPEWFMVDTKEGLTLEFGNTADSKFIPDGQNTVYTWMVNKIYDNYGNYMSFKYHNSNGENYIEEINYTGNPNASLAPYNQVKFYYDSREDQTTGFIAGGKTRSTVILREIEIFSEGLSYKKYNFNYTYNNVYSFLSEVVEHGADRSNYNSLLFSYQDDLNSAAPISQTTTIGNPDPFFKAYIPVNINENGKTDLLRLSYNDPTDPQPWKTWSLLENAGNNQFNSIHSSSFPAQDFIQLGFYPFNKTERGNMLFESLDLDGDSKEDVIFIQPIPSSEPNSGPTIKLHFYLSSNNYASSQTTLDAVGDDPRNLWFLDFNGDQKMDILNSYSPSVGSSIVNGQGVSTTLLQGWLDIVNSTSGSPDFTKVYYGAPNTSGGTYDFSKVLISDVDGDGKAEMVNIAEFANPTVKYILRYDTPSNPAVLISDNSGLAYEAGVYNPTTDCLGSNEMSLLGDFNGDLKTDVLVYNRFGPGSSFTWSMNLGKGDGSYENSILSSTLFTDPYSVCGVRHLARDLNFDGKTDILEYSYDLSSTTLNINVYYCDGTSFVRESHGVSVAYSDFTFGFGDFNGDGSSDLFIYSQFDVTKSPQIVYFTKGIRSKYLKQAVDGYNVKTQLEFEAISAGSHYSLSNIKTYPLSIANGPLYVTTKVTRPDGVGGDNITEYTYEDLIIHKAGKGLIGFLKMKEFNNISNLEIVNEYDYDPMFFNLIPLRTLTTLVTKLNVTPVSRITYTVNTNSLGGIRYIATLTNSLNEDLISGKSVKTSLTFDNYGNNLTKIIEVNNNYETETIVNSFIQSGAWIPSKLANTVSTITRAGQASYSRSISYFYNPQDKGQVSSAQTDVGLLTNFQYNALTGVTTSKSTFAPNNSSLIPRVTTYDEYDIYFRFPIKERNSLNQITETTFDGRWGKILSEKGVDGLVTNYTYDQFGRMVGIKTGDNLHTLTSYDWVQPGTMPLNDPITVSDVLFSVTEKRTGRGENVIFYDAFERERKTQTDGFSDKVYTVTGYDSRSNLAIKSNSYQTSAGNPFNPVLTTFFYDEVNRLVKVEKTNNVIPQPLTTTYGYTYGGGNTTITTTEPDNKTKSKTTDATGALIAVIDNSGTLTYDYCSNRKIKTVSFNGVPLKSHTYDIFGRENAVQDANSGLTTYQYNEYDQLISQTDANNRTYTLGYDVLGRLTQKTGPDGTYAYQYVTSGSGINKLLLSAAPNGISNKYFYDSFNRTVKIEKNINNQVFTTSFLYDNFNNLIQTTYPSGFRVKRDYTGSGLLSKVSRVDNNQLIWQADEMNPLGHYSKYTLGNGIQTQKKYSDFDLLMEISAANIQDLHYDINPANGNVNHRTDGIIGLTETFTYDQLDRLTGSAIAGSVSIGYPVSYAPNGNITNKSDAGTYTYLSNKPNAVETVSNSDSQISLLQQDISYTPFGKVQTVSEGDYQLSIIYGPDQQRAKTDLFYQGILKSSKYFVGNYEKQISPGNIQEVHYIDGGDGLAAIFVIENGVGNIYYAHKDMLGSILTLTDQQGNKIAEQNFDAWGRYRDPSDWSYSETAIPSWLYRGFTGHEHLPEFSLINMNGRVYDPVLGLMLSADPVLADNTNSQAYNGYIYALNNPLKYIDKDGKCPICIVVAIGAIVGGVINVVTHWDAIQESEKPWLAGAAAFGIGAVAGGLSTLATVAGGPQGGIISGFITGALAAGLSSAVLQIGNHQVFGDPYQSTEQNISQMLAGGILGGILGGWSAGMDNRNIWTGKPEIEPFTVEPRQMTKLYDPDINSSQEITVSEPSSSLPVEGESITYNIRTNPQNSDKIGYVDPERGAFAIEKIEIKGYNPRVDAQTDAFHQFPKSFDKQILEGGYWQQNMSDLSAGKIGWTVKAPGNVIKNGRIYWGTYEIGINDKGIIFHKFFRPF